MRTLCLIFLILTVSLKANSQINYYPGDYLQPYGTLDPSQRAIPEPPQSFTPPINQPYGYGQPYYQGPNNYGISPSDNYQPFNYGQGNPQAVQPFNYGQGYPQPVQPFNYGQGYPQPVQPFNYGSP